MDSVKISIIVPVYNTENYLEDCIFSILNQTFEDFEVIFVDDGSTDNSLNILNEFANNDQRLKVIHFDENKGVSYARNAGLDNAKGDYIIFIDSDDIFEFEALGEVYSLAEKFSLDMLIFKLQNFDNNTGENVYRRNFDMKFLKDIVGDDVFNFSRVVDYFFKISPTIPGKLFRKDLIGSLRFPEKLIFEDNPFFIAVFLNADRIYFYDKYLYNRRLRDDSISHSFFNQFSDSVEIYEKIITIVEDNQVYDVLKEQLLRNQCKDIFNRFTQVDDTNKKDFFEKIKISFSNLKDKLEADKTLANSNEKTRIIFYSAIEAKTANEYELMVQDYFLKCKIEKLQREFSSLKSENDKTKNEIIHLNKLNSEILNSNSWKITEPLRNIRNIFKKF